MKKQLSVFILAILSLSLTACIDQYSPRDRTLELTTGVVQVFTAHSDTSSTKLNWYLDGAEVATEAAQYTYTAPQTIGTHKLQVIEYVKIFWSNTYTKGDTITWTITVVEPVTPICYLDEDGDGYGDPAKQIQSDTPPTNCVDNSDDCNDSNASINPEAHEICNSIDDDCDGQVDENVQIAYHKDNDNDGYGVSAIAGYACTVPSGNVLNGNDCNDNNSNIHPNAGELCDGVDNDCDNSVDENLTQSCPQGQTGSIACVNGQMVNSCEGECVPTGDEVCDGLDNDCDGSVDEDIAAVSTTCGIGQCARTGQQTCVGGKMVDSCVQGNPAAEVCDGLDNDCNGTVDNVAPVNTTCGIGECVRTGQKTCVNGQLVDSCTPGASTAEVCDGKDNDCNGTVDNGIAPVSITCGIGECVRTGQKTCVGGKLVDTCTPGVATAEVCDGLDNDCNGTVDNNIPPKIITCGLGECARSYVISCFNGQMGDDAYVCIPGNPVAEVCDGKDNDCDGTVDNIPPVSTTCGVGECASTGLKTCVSGALVDSCKPGTPGLEVCDGKDNDCNGTTDNGIAPVNTTCGIGQCASTGQKTCVGGALVDSCTPGTPGFETCDGLDNDCNGSIDEGVKSTFYRDADGDGYGNIANTSQACTTPAGYVTNTTDCNDSLATVNPGALEVCTNYIDDNCDGSTDEECPDPNQLAQDGLNLLIEHLQSFMVNGTTPTSIEDILPPAVVEDIRTNYFQAALDLDSDNPSAHLGFAVMEVVNLAYDVDSVAVIDFMLNMLTGAGSSGTSDLGGMATMLFEILNSSAADYLNNALGHMNYAVNLNTDIVLNVYMPAILTDEFGVPIPDPETGRPQFQKDVNGKLVFETEQTSMQCDQTDVVLLRGIVNLGMGALHLYKAYDLNITDANGTYDYFGEMVFEDPATGKADMQSFQSFLLALKYNDKRPEFLTMLTGGPAHTQASKGFFLAAIVDIIAGLNDLTAETDDQTDDIVTVEIMKSVYDSIVEMVVGLLPDMTLPEFSIAYMIEKLERMTLMVNSTASNRLAFDLDEFLATVPIDFSLNLAGLFAGSITNLHQFLPYHYWFYLDNTTAYPSTFPAKAMVDDSIGMLYGLTLPVPLNAYYTESELASKKTLLGGIFNLGAGLIGNSSINIDNIFATPAEISMTVYFPDITFGGIVQGLTQTEVDAIMDMISTALTTPETTTP